jgi:hypothetical protein
MGVELTVLLQGHGKTGAKHDVNENIDRGGGEGLDMYHMTLYVQL